MEQSPASSPGYSDAHNRSGLPMTLRKRIADTTIRIIAYVVIPGALVLMAFAATIALN